jgi:hypothetical protein
MYDWHTRIFNDKNSSKHIPSGFICYTLVCTRQNEAGKSTQDASNDYAIIKKKTKKQKQKIEKKNEKTLLYNTKPTNIISSLETKRPLLLPFLLHLDFPRSSRQRLTRTLLQLLLPPVPTTTTTTTTCQSSTSTTTTTITTTSSNRSSLDTTNSLPMPNFQNSRKAFPFPFRRCRCCESGIVMFICGGC